MSKKSKSKNIEMETSVTVILIVCLLLIVMFGVTYLMVIYTRFGNIKGEVSTSLLTLNYVGDNNDITIQNTLPISDSVGKNLQLDESNGGVKGYFDFTISNEAVGNTETNYEIYALKQSVAEEISENYIKIYLTDGVSENPYTGYTDVKVPVYRDLKVASSNPAGRRLYAGKFIGSGVKNFRLRMWLADTYTINSTVKSFSIKLNVKTGD